MKFFRYILLLTAILTNIFFGLNCAQTKETHENITIFVHGSHTLSKLFISYVNKPDELIKIDTLSSKYYTPVIARTLQTADAKEFPSNSFYVFGWSGNISNSARQEAAAILFAQLQKLLCSYKEKNIIPKITIITHSHGGNVALNLVNHNPDFNIDKLILLACPVQEATKNLVGSPIFKKVYNLYSICDFIQILDPQRLHIINLKNNLCPFFSERSFAPCANLKQARIKLNGYELSHTKFISPHFFINLPIILQTMDLLESNNLRYIININKPAPVRLTSKL